jgi:flavin reductase (DIM6/NTAB) family NADH-FMN oxidoreductase RutF
MDLSSAPQSDPENLRKAMRHWVAGVTVVTCAFKDARYGMTASSFTSISLTPPMILVSIEKNTHTHGLIQSAGYFGVTLLAEDQKALSERFAGRLDPEMDRFKDVETFSLVSPAPLLVDGLAWFDCRVVHTAPAGTSTVFLAEVMAAKSRDAGEPLVYTDRAYYKLQK